MTSSTSSTSKTTPNFIVLDSESDGLAYECTKLHILSYTSQELVCDVCLGEGILMGGPETYGKTCVNCKGYGKHIEHLSDYDDMRELLNRENTLFIAHNSVCHDMVVFNRILGVPMDYKKWVDTLALSWCLWPDRPKHGLDSFSDEAGVKKPKVDDWENVSWQQMKERCGNDVLINWYVWTKAKKRLEEIYET